MWRRDVIARTGECGRGEALMRPIILGGRLVEPLPTLEQARARAAESVAKLTPALRELEDAEPWPVIYSRELRELIDRTQRQLRTMSTIFFDIDTQLDFVYPSGALYVPRRRADRAGGRLPESLCRGARCTRSSPRLTPTPKMTSSSVSGRITAWLGTLGQRKAEETLLAKRVVIPNCNCELRLEGAQQIVIEKQTVDAFQVPNLQRVVNQLGGDRFVVYGVVTEICVLFAVRGLLNLGKPVTVVTDAIETLRDEDSRRALAEMQDGGARLATLQQVLTGTYS